ncbi:MAG: efflux RND transporter permease subunit [Candidatus Rokubacteria bacterium]|nr:efflux RND transporter permease subunit [Candidatus Rokubacteria bacterium]
MKLNPRESWRFKTKEALVEAMREKIKVIPGAAFTFTQPIADMIDDLMSGARAQIAVKIFGDDLSELEKLGDQVQKVMGAIEGVGAEIPKPLATVVIGGLITSTVLTLFLLPLVYHWVEGRGKASSGQA